MMILLLRIREKSLKTILSIGTFLLCINFRFLCFFLVIEVVTVVSNIQVKDEEYKFKYFKV